MAWQEAALEMLEEVGIDDANKVRSVAPRAGNANDRVPRVGFERMSSLGQHDNASEI